MMGRRLLFVFVATAAVSACHDPNKYVPSSPETPNGTLTSPILDLTSDPTTIRATGAAHAVITAHIDPRSIVKTMNFATTRGVLSGHGLTTSADKTSIDIPVDDSGVASVDLQSGTQAGTATVTASITRPDATAPRTFTKTVDVVFSAVSSSDAISITVRPASADADGVSQVVLTAQMMPEVAAANRMVTFTASAGEFTSNKDATTTPQATVQTSGDVASVALKSPTQPGTVIVTARAGGFTATGQVTFARANPDTIFVQPAKPTVDRVGGTVLITVFLVRDSGQTTTNTVVTYEAHDSSGALIGTFLAPTIAAIDQDDPAEPFKRLKSTATFDPDDTVVPGIATITVRAGGKTASTSINILP